MAAAALYARQARRIRRTFHSSPASRFVALRQLAEASDRLGNSARAARPVATAEPAVGVFSRLVRSQVSGSLLRYSVRQRLIAQARELGIGRFDANLIIAAVIHHGPLGDLKLPIVDSIAGVGKRWDWRRGAALVAATVALQAGIALVIWAMLFRA